MRVEINGKSVASGASDDGYIECHEPSHVEESRTGHHWKYVYEDVPSDAIVILEGYSRNGAPYKKK